jgi:hypothetical protein
VRHHRFLSILGVTFVVAAIALPFARGQESLELAGEAEAFALRVEYDVPVPAGSGTIPHVIGEIRKTAGSNAKGLAAAPTNFDAVVGGTVYNPYQAVNGNNGPFRLGDVDTGITPPVPPQNGIPTTECFYPGAGTDTVVRWPTDLRAETSPVTPVSYANAQCDQTPQTKLTAWAAAADSPGYPTEAVGSVVHAGNVSGDALLRPNEGHVESASRASAESISILEGVIRIGSVEAEGLSTADGPGGKASTTGHVAVSNINAGGQTFSVANDELTVAGQSFPVSSAEARSFVDSLNTTLQPTGCNLTILGPAERFPQGFLLARKPPKLGVEADGTFGASMHGGLLVLCDIPAGISEPTTFSPQRVQILVGFEYTMARAAVAPGGFGLGGLIGGAPNIAQTTPGQTTTVTTGAEVAPSTPSQAPTGSQRQALAPRRTSVSVRPFGAATRWILVVIGFVLLMLATNVAARRLREALSS